MSLMILKVTARLVPLIGLLLAASCGKTDSSGSDTVQPPPDAGVDDPREAGSTPDTGTAETGPSPDPSYRRDCQTGDFTCDDWGCEGTLVSGECYARCTPESTAAIGAPDDECTEPERPFCGQTGRSLGGDWDCNECAHVCMAQPDVHQCLFPADRCE